MASSTFSCCSWVGSTGSSEIMAVLHFLAKSPASSNT